MRSCLFQSLSSTEMESGPRPLPRLSLEVIILLITAPVSSVVRNPRRLQGMQRDSALFTPINGLLIITAASSVGNAEDSFWKLVSKVEEVTPLLNDIRRHPPIFLPSSEVIWRHLVHEAHPFFVRSGRLMQFSGKFHQIDFFGRSLTTPRRPSRADRGRSTFLKGFDDGQCVWKPRFEIS